MRNDPLDTEGLQAFVHVVEDGSVAAAARELNLPRATVSRRLAKLEERLDVRLLHRTTRSQSLTDAGHELFHHARNVLKAVREAEDALRRADGVPRGRLRVSMPPAQDPFLSFLTSFLEKYPQVQLEVDCSTRYVDVVAEGFDVTLRAGSGPIPDGLIARRLRRMQSHAWASRSYLARAGTPMHPDELATHDLLVAFAEGVRPVTHWPLLDGGRIRVRGRLATNDLPAIAAACHAGLGIAMLPDVFATRRDRHDLVQVLPDHLGSGGALTVVYAERAFMPPAVRAFVDHLVEWIDSPAASTLSAGSSWSAGS